MKDIISNEEKSVETSDKMNNSIIKDESTKSGDIKNIIPQIESNSAEIKICEESQKELVDEYLTTKSNNPVVSYYYKTLSNLQKSDEYMNIYSLLLNSKNYIPKSNTNYFDRNYIKSKYNDKYINNYRHINNCIYELNNNFFCNNTQQDNNMKLYNYNNSIFLSQNFSGNNANTVNKGINYTDISYSETKKENLEKSDSLNTLVKDIDCPPFIPLNYINYSEKETEKELFRKDSNDSSKDKESDSTSAVSEKREEENNFSSFNKTEKCKYSEKIIEGEYLVKMFGRKGWICRLCNNFNYETRNKCNRCGILKKAKKFVDLKQKTDQKANNNEAKERNNKKGDWICINCRNLNYSFRTICNRCKIPKINAFVNGQNILKGKEMNNFEKFQFYSFSPCFVFFNNVE
jgi:hypothetical protein